MGTTGGAHVSPQLFFMEMVKQEQYP